jgi:hypothetical protein
MSSLNEIWLNANGHAVRLDLDDETQLLPTFQANDRTKPDTIQSEYSPEFSVPGTAHNHRLLKQAAASQPVDGSGYKRVPAVLTSGGVETMPLALLYLKGYRDGRYLLQLFGGNKRLVEALGDKKLADLDLSRFDHYWTPAAVLAGLPFAHWQQNGWGYEVYERGRPLDLQALDPYTLYPSCSDQLVWSQILADAGFTADSLLAEPLAAALNVPSANPYTFSQDYRDDRRLKAGFEHTGSLIFTDEFNITAPVNFIGTKPYGRGKEVQPTAVHTYVVPTLGYYDLDLTFAVYFGCEPAPLPGEVSMETKLFLNGNQLLNPDGSPVRGYKRVGDYTDATLTAAIKRVRLNAGDVLEARIQGDKYPRREGFVDLDPVHPVWYIGTRVVRFPGATYPPDFSGVEPACSFTVTLLPEFPEGGLVKLNEWLPDMKQLDFVKSRMLLLGLTIQADDYAPHLHLAPGSRLLANVPKARNWSAKRDAYAQPGRLPERDLAFRFGEYGQRNLLKWTEDENVTKAYGDGSIAVADEVLADEYELATLPFSATENSPGLPGLLRILNFEGQDLSATPPTYSAVEAKPRLTLRSAASPVNCQLITTPAKDGQPAVLAPVDTVFSYFDGADLSLLLDRTVLTTYWADLRAMLEQSRYLTEYYRLTPRDIAELDFSVPIWDSGLGDYFAVSAVGEYDARRPVEVRLARLYATHLPPAALPGGLGQEWYGGEFFNGEFY